MAIYMSKKITEMSVNIWGAKRRNLYKRALNY